MCCDKKPCDPCNKCKSTTCKCNYTGPNYTNPEVYDGQDINEAISNIAEYLSEITFEDGVGIVDITNHGDGTFTITLSDGSTYNVGNFTGPQGPPGEDGSQGIQGPIGPPGPEQLIIQNTLIVAKNGNDATALADDWAKPFLTVTAASAAASAGDLVIVFPGVYNENNFLKTDVNYDFKLGVTMVSTNDCINDSAGTMNINIVGEGNFYSSSGRGMLIVNPSTNVYMRLRNMVGLLDGIAIGNANKIDIKGEYIAAYQQYTATIRGNSVGKIHFDTWDGSNSSLGGATIFFTNHSQDLETREFKITGDIILSNSTSYGAIGIDNSPTLRVIAEIDIKHESGIEDDSFSAIYVRSGSLKYTGRAESIDNVGLILQDFYSSSVTLSVKNSEIIGKRLALRIATAGSSYARIENSVLRKSDDTGAAVVLIDAVDQNAQLILRDSDLYNPASGTGADGIYTEDALSIVRLSDVKVVVASEVGFLMDSGVVRTVDIESIVSSNKGLSGNVTNGITGSLLVVDANIEDNTLNF